MKALDGLNIRGNAGATHQTADLFCRVLDSLDSGEGVAGAGNPRNFFKVGFVDDPMRANFDYTTLLVPCAVLRSAGTVGNIPNRYLVGLAGHVWALIEPFTAD